MRGCALLCATAWVPGKLNRKKAKNIKLHICSAFFARFDVQSYTKCSLQVIIASGVPQFLLCKEPFRALGLVFGRAHHLMPGDLQTDQDDGVEICIKLVLEKPDGAEVRKDYGSIESFGQYDQVNLESNCRTERF
jgi:hypothetical protein